MSSEPMSLAQIQREMAAAIMRPLTPDEDMQVRAIDGRPMTAVAESFIAPNSSANTGTGSWMRLWKTFRPCVPWLGAALLMRCLLRI
jgi:hypothetical protein